jgi:hypothetical protein
MPGSSNKTAKDIYEDALKLGKDEREKLFFMLTQQTGSGFAAPDIEQAWIEECDRRVQLIEEGKAGWVDGDEALQELRKTVAE